MKKPPKDSRRSLENWNDLWWVSSLGINLVLSSAVGLLLGRFLDSWLHTKPVLTIAFFAVGMLAGFIQIIREVKKLGADEKKKLDH